MIKIFSGNWRGLGEDKSAGFGMIIDFKFREILHKFKGAPLGVFMCLALHSDEKGHSFPGYDLISKETGYNRSTIAQALDVLCDLKIDGHRILMRYREHDTKGMFEGSNHYLIFPTLEELTQDSPKLHFPTVDKNSPELDFPQLGFSTVGKIRLEVKPVVKLNQDLSKSTEVISDPEIKPPEKKKGDWLDVLMKYGTPPDQKTGVLNEYPVDVQPFLSKFLELFPFENNEVPTKKQTSQKGFWIQGLREVQRACAEYGIGILDDVFKDWQKSRYVISHPGALTRAVTGKVIEKRTKKVDPPSGPTAKQWTAEESEKLKAAIRLAKP